MKALKSILLLSFLGAMLTLNTGCPPYQAAAGAALGTEFLLCAAYTCRGPVYAPVVVPYVPVYQAPVYIPVPPPQGPFYNSRPCIMGPLGCISLNDKELKTTQLADAGLSRYGIEVAAREKLLAGLSEVQNGNMEAAKNLGLKSSILSEYQSPTGISDISATQIANAIGASPSGVINFVHDLNKSRENKELLEPKFDYQCSDNNCG